MSRRRRRDDVELDGFIEDGFGTPDSQETWMPEQSSPASPLIPQLAQWPRGSLLDPTNNRRHVSCSRTASSCSDVGIGDELDDDDLSLAGTPVLGVLGRNARLLREAAVNAYSPIRKHARMDLGYISDIADADDLDDADELDAEAQHDAPFETQAQSDLADAT